MSQSNRQKPAALKNTSASFAQRLNFKLEIRACMADLEH
jgi:hypothetical protein